MDVGFLELLNVWMKIRDEVQFVTMSVWPVQLSVNQSHQFGHSMSFVTALLHPTSLYYSSY